jgi:hypothetical protein
MRTGCVFRFVGDNILLILLDFDVSVTRELGVIRKPVAFISTIDERGQGRLYTGMRVYDVFKENLVLVVLLVCCGSSAVRFLVYYYCQLARLLISVRRAAGAVGMHRQTACNKTPHVLDLDTPRTIPFSRPPNVPIHHPVPHTP